MIEINSVTDLQSLLNAKFPKEKISLRISCDTSKYEKRLNNYITDCGCSMGAFFMITAIAVTAIVAPLAAASLWHTLIWGVVFCFVMAVAGKFTGLLMARIHFYNTIKKLIKKYMAAQQSMPLETLPEPATQLADQCL